MCVVGVGGKGSWFSNGMMLVSYKGFALGSQPVVQKSDAKLAIEQLILRETFSRYLKTST